MALLWCEGFDQYGTDENAMLDGNWAEVDAGSIDWALSTTQARTGTYSIFHGISDNTEVLRRVLGKTTATVGVGFSMHLEHLPRANNVLCILDLRDDQNLANISIVCQSTGVLEVFRGDTRDGVSLGATSSPAIICHGWQHIEVLSTIAASGSVEIRVNEVEVLSLTGVNTVADATESYYSGTPNANCAQVGFPMRESTALSTTALPTQYLDDIYIYDDSGSYNNTWIGDQRVSTLFPTADTAQADWTALSGSGYTNIDDASPDDDTTYVYAGAPGSPSVSTSEFDIGNLSGTSGTVAAVTMGARVRKDEAGSADYQNGIVSSSVEAKGDVVPANPVYTYHETVFETDPNSGVAFTPTNVNNLLIQINRVT